MLTVEFAAMERIAMQGSQQENADAYWCELAARPAFHCLDVGTPSTLSNALNVTAFDEFAATGSFLIANPDNVTLFGQYDECRGKVVGDGLISVHDLSVLLSYIFGDYAYADLSSDPSQIVTVQGRDGLEARCGANVSRVDYMALYAADSCAYMPPLGDGRRLQEELAPRADGALWSDLWRNFSHPVVEASTVPSPSNPLVRRWTRAFHARTVTTHVAHQMSTVAYELQPEVESGMGHWWMLRLGSLPLRLQVSFAGLPDQATTLLSNRLFDGSPPDDPGLREVRFTRVRGCTASTARGAARRWRPSTRRASR